MCISFLKIWEKTLKIDIGCQLFKSPVALDLWHNNILTIISLSGTLQSFKRFINNQSQWKTKN